MVAGRRHTNGRHAWGGRCSRGRLRDEALPKGGGRPPRPPGNGQVEAAQHCLAEGIAGREREARPASRGWRERRVAALGGGALSPLREMSRRPLISPHRDAHYISQERHTCINHASVQNETPAAPASAETGVSGDSAKTGQKPGAIRTGVNTPSTAFETIGSHVLDADSWCRLERERAPWGHKKRDGSSETGPAARRMPTWRFLSLEAGPFLVHFYRTISRLFPPTPSTWLLASASAPRMRTFLPPPAVGPRKAGGVRSLVSGSLRPLGGDRRAQCPISVGFASGPVRQGLGRGQILHIREIGVGDIVGFPTNGPEKKPSVGPRARRRPAAPAPTPPVFS